MSAIGGTSGRVVIPDAAPGRTLAEEAAYYVRMARRREGYASEGGEEAGFWTQGAGAAWVRAVVALLATD